MIERQIKVPVELTPQELAFEFCNMHAGNQARFFNEVAAITQNWDRPFCFQLQFIIENAELTSEGQEIMELIGDYGTNRRLRQRTSLTPIPS